ncbi:MAG: DUF1800 family protein [Chitinophagaceae bacterium]|nr:DUF1800 family protein [Chitinophagaceae bacterium]
MGTRKAAHLLRRTTFGPTRKQIENFAIKTANEAVNILLDVIPITSKPIDPATGETWVVDFRKPNNSEDYLLQKYLIGWWLDNARRDDTILHKMIFFLHQNWVTNYDNKISEIFYDYLKLLEYYAIGNYKTLAYKMSLNNSMLIQLDGNTSSASNPNENYAREFLELFTIGRESDSAFETYTENDIKEAAKIFTGFRYSKNNSLIDPDTGIRRCTEVPYTHSFGTKYFSDSFQKRTITSTAGVEDMYTEVSDFVDLVFEQTATAKNICRKLYRYFLYPHISEEAESDIITPLSEILMNNNYELRPVLETLLVSKHFYDEDDSVQTDEFIGAKIKSPLDLLLGTMRFFNILPPDPIANSFDYYDNFYRSTIQIFFLPGGGMDTFSPSTIAGYKPYYQAPDYDRLWMNSSTIIYRYMLGRMLVENKKVLVWGPFFAPFDILAWVDTPENISDPRDGIKVVDELLTFLFPENPKNSSRFDFFLNDLLLGSLSLMNWQMDWDNYKTTGDSTSVVLRLQNLFKGILSSQEYQLL